MYEAARVDDTLFHTSALTGFIVGSLVGALIILVAAAYVASVVFTGGATLAATASCFAAGLATNAVISLAAAVVGSAVRDLGEAIGSLFKHQAGTIITGSPNVFINSRPAARAVLSNVNCDDHAPLPRIAQGSTSIFINGEAAARKDDRTECDAVIDSGSSTVFFGGGTATYLKIEGEVNDQHREISDGVFFAAGIIGGVAGVAKNAAKLGTKCIFAAIAGELAGAGLGYAAGHYGGQAIKAITGSFGYPIDVVSGQKFLAGDEDEIDFTLDGFLPLIWQRRYHSDNPHTGALGRGWSLFWEQSLRWEAGQIVYRNEEGREIVFPPLAKGQRYFCETEHFWLARSHNDRYAVSSPFDTCFIFAPLAEQGLALLTSIKNLTQQALHFGYDDAQQLATITTDSGYHLSCQYENGRLSTVTGEDEGSNGCLVSYQYNDLQQLISVTNRLGQKTRQFAYEHDLMTELTDQRGLVCYYHWATIGDTPRVVRHRTNTGLDWQLDYDIPGQTTSVTDLTQQHQAIWHYNHQQAIIRYQDVDGAVYHFEHDEKTQLPTRFTLPDARFFSLKYDPLARPIQLTDPLGRETTLEYHRHSLAVTCRHFPDGSEWRADYDEQGRLLSETPSGQGTTRYHYEGASPQPHRVINPVGGETQLSWNTKGLLTCYTDCSHSTTHYHYTAAGYLDRVIDALEQETHYHYNRVGQLTDIEHADGSRERWRYNPQGLLQQHRDSNGHTRQWDYNHLGLPLRYTDRLNRSLHYHYDPYGRLTQLDNANGGQYRFRWSVTDQLLSEQRPDQTEKRYHYNQSGLVAQVESLYHRAEQQGVSRGIEFTYDAANRLICRASQSAVTTYRYDLADRLCQLERHPTAQGVSLGIAAHQLDFTYDNAGRLINEQQGEHRLAYSWDSLGNLSALTLPNQQTLGWLSYGSGHTSALRYNQQLISEFSRDGLQREIQRTQGALTQQRGYDALGRRNWQSAQPGQPSALTLLNARQGKVWRLYGFNRDGELSQTDDAIRGQQRYSYDSEGRLTSAERYDQFSVAEYFNYDQADNLQQPAPNAADACLKHNRLRQWQQGHYEYDGWGNLIRHQQGSEVQHFVYDDDNQLINAYGNGPKGPHQTHYAYDGLGRRISKRVQQPGHALKETQFIWQGLRLLQEKQAQQTTTYVYDPNEAYTPLARIVQRGQQGETIDYFHTDLNGMPLDVTDAQGNLIWSAKYSAWGKVTRQNHDPATPGDLLPESHQPLRYPGQYGDDETGLHYNMFRYYDPNVGRFITPDPLGLKCWNTTRKDFWKNEANTNPNKYSQRNIDRMNKGLAPKMKVQIYNRSKDIVEVKNISLEIHHKHLPQRGGSQKAHEIWNLEKTTPWGHASMDPYRHTGYDLVKILKGPNSW